MLHSEEYPLPTVSVILPVRDGAAYISAAVQSILCQSHRDLELIIIDDGSVDSTPGILAGFAASDPRVQVHRRPGRGLVATLNEGLEIATGEYMARMDADDVSFPHRLIRQLEHMEARPGCVLLGTGVRIFGNTISDQDVLPETENETIRFKALFQNPFFHPTVLLRSSLIKEKKLRYDPEFLHAEDYDFWVRLMGHGEVQNLPEVLLRYRRHEETVGSKYNAIQVANANKVRHRVLRTALGIVAEGTNLTLHGLIGSMDKVRCVVLRKDVRDWLNRLENQNRESGYVAPPSALIILEHYRNWLEKRDFDYLKGLLFPYLRRNELASLRSRS